MGPFQLLKRWFGGFAIRRQRVRATVIACFLVILFTVANGVCVAANTTWEMSHRNLVTGRVTLGLITFDSNNIVVGGTFTEINGSSGTFTSGQLYSSMDGLSGFMRMSTGAYIYMFTGNACANGEVIAYVSSDYSPRDGDGVGMGTLVKRSGSFTTADLQGPWRFQSIESQTNSSYGSMSFQTSGSFSGSITNSNGQGAGISGNVALDGSGNTTGSFYEAGSMSSILSGQLNQSKNILVLTSSSGSEASSTLALKATGSFSLSDLNGSYKFVSLLTGPLQGLAYGTLNIDAKGRVTTGNTFYDMINGFRTLSGGRFSITATGSVSGSLTLAGSTIGIVDGQMSSDKYMATFLGRDSAGNTMYAILMKQVYRSPCTYSLSSSTGSFTPSGGNDSIWVTWSNPPGTTCLGPISPSASDPWITVTTGSISSSNGTYSCNVRITVAATSAKYGRTGTVNLSGQTYTVTQSGTGVRIGSVSGDFDGDGKPDILWQDDFSGALTIWTMNGTTKVDVASLNPSEIADTNWKIVGVGDFNGDGDPDLVWYYKGIGMVGVWLMNGTNLVTPVWTTPNQLADTNWNIVGIGDFNGDGHPDIVWQHDSGYLGVWLMNGTTMVTAAWLNPSHLTDPAWRVVGVGDFNGDGKPDLLWYHSVGGWLGVWLMDGTSMMTAAWLTPSTIGDRNWRVAGVGDFNGDGKPDILWQHAAGSLGTWLMNGSTMVTPQWLNPSSVSDPDLKIVGPK